MSITCGGEGPDSGVTDLAKQYGSKPAALITWLRSLLRGNAADAGTSTGTDTSSGTTGDGRGKGKQSVPKSKSKVIIFSMWDDVLHITSETLRLAGLQNAFVEGDRHSQVAALHSFTDGSIDILMLSTLAKASGTNLQCANHIAFLDPPGHNPQHGAALERSVTSRFRRRFTFSTSVFPVSVVVVFAEGNVVMGGRSAASPHTRGNLRHH
jgi:hypothetical protein